MKYPLKQILPQLFLRLALALTFLSAVADRLGILGKNTIWGNWENFVTYTRQITAFLPQSLSEFGAYAATFLEIVFALFLILGFKTKITAFASGSLLLIFALSMCITLGIKATFDYSVWVGSAAAFLLSVQEKFPFSIDENLNQPKK